MAQIFPRLSTSELEQLPSRAEARLYKELRDLDYPELEVYFSLATQVKDQRGTWVGEIDFLLFHPKEGIQIWEVKGGGIRVDGEGRWFSQGRNKEHRLSTTPLAQLQKTSAAIIQAIKEVMGSSLTLPIAPVLVFPDTANFQGDFPNLALNKNHLLLKDDCQPLTAAAISQRFNNAPFAGAKASNSLPLNKEQANFIRSKVLRPKCSLVPTGVENAEEVEAELIQLSYEQQWVLRLLENIPRMAIFGGAGTGKSVLARLQAEEQAAKGNKVLFLCFNNALAEEHRKFFAASSNKDKIEVLTFHGLCSSRAEQAGLEFNPAAAPKIKDFYNITAAEILLEALEKNPEQWQALVVDEAQDYQPDWWLILNELLSEDASITLFADPEQNLYQRNFALPSDVFAGFIPYPFTLHTNYRNAFEIATWLKEEHTFAAEPSDRLPSSNNPVEIIHWKKEAEQAEKLLVEIEKLEEQGFKPADLLLLTPIKTENSQALQELLKHKPNYKSACYNIAASKGLESKAVILVDLGTNHFTSKEAMQYVGASRAKVLLKVFRFKG